MSDQEEGPRGVPPLLVHVSAGGAALLWSAADARDLRERHGIAGSPAGSLARQPRQNSRLGLPVILMAEEARLLAETGAAVLVRPAAAVGGEETERRVQELEEERERGFREQRRLAIRERRARMRGDLADTIARGREAKRRRARGGRGDGSGGGGETRGGDGMGGGGGGGRGDFEERPELDVEPTEDAGERDKVTTGERGEQKFEEGMELGEACADHRDAGQEAEEDNAAAAAAAAAGDDEDDDDDEDDAGLQFTRESMLVQVRTSRAALRVVECRAASAPWAHPPIAPHHELRYRVYRDLQRRGLHLTSGAKFGGDFLVYPGDPLRFHSHFIALCRDDERPMALVELLAAARLGSNVKKTVLLCSPMPRDGVRYTSLQWSGWK
uniref:tRNA-splicing endonuclease subunit SEN34 n=1 Tax=Petromyzon marinus TaxID=7757 RepID=A0AAJ7X6R6_PETMA|nr:tRNA-splicing endonuclease subunit Sen34 isoform X1 [Petromyzon marinus]